ncbi:MAG TPA: hypothetical protein VGE97_06350 [Nitrososphaera sp.]
MSSRFDSTETEEWKRKNSQQGTSWRDNINLHQQKTQMDKILDAIKESKNLKTNDNNLPTYVKTVGSGSGIKKITRPGSSYKYTMTSYRSGDE